MNFKLRLSSSFSPNMPYISIFLARIPYSNSMLELHSLHAQQNGSFPLCAESFLPLKLG